MFGDHDALREVFVRDCDLHGVWHHDPKMWVSHLCRKGYAVSVDDVFSGDDVVWVLMARINQNGLGTRKIFVRVPLDLVERILVLGYVPDLAQIGG